MIAKAPNVVQLSIERLQLRVCPKCDYAVTQLVIEKEKLNHKCPRCQRLRKKIVPRFSDFIPLIK